MRCHRHSRPRRAAGCAGTHGRDRRHWSAGAGRCRGLRPEFARRTRPRPIPDARDHRLRGAASRGEPAVESEGVHDRQQHLQQRIQSEHRSRPRAVLPARRHAERQSHEARHPAPPRPINATTVSHVRSGRPRRFCVMWQKSRCLKRHSKSTRTTMAKRPADSEGHHPRKQERVRGPRLPGCHGAPSQAPARLRPQPGA